MKTLSDTAMEYGRFTGRPALDAMPPLVPSPARRVSIAVRRGRTPPLRALLTLLLGLLACLALAQRDDRGGGGPGGGLELVSVTGGGYDEGFGYYAYYSDTRGYGADSHAGFYADCDGQITYKYKWNKAFGPPPQQAVVHLQSEATLEGESGDECADGLGDAMVPEDRHGTYTAYSRGERYRIMSLSGDTLEVKLTPHVYSSYLASVWVRVDAAPVTVTLGGPRITASGAYECMIGKGISGSFSAGGYPLNGRHWSIGGSTFKSYTANNDQGKVYPLATSDLALEHPHWFWKEPSSALVSCSATVTLPDGSTKPVSAQTGADIYAPDNYFGANALSSLCYMGSGTSTADYNHVLSWPPPSSNLSDTLSPCINFYGAVKTLDRFWANGDPGEHCYVQLTRTLDLIRLFGMSAPYPTKNTWGRFDLDNAFPYLLTEGDDGFWPANLVMTGQLVAIDGPYMGLVSYVDYFRMDETYRMFQLYHPPSADGDWAWVPLNVIEWEVFAEASWPWPAAGSSIPGSRVKINSAGATSTHPEWEHSIDNHGGGAGATSPSS